MIDPQSAPAPTHSGAPLPFNPPAAPYEADQNPQAWIPQTPTLAAKTPFPQIGAGSPGFTLCKTPIDDIATRRDACLRQEIDPNRVEVLRRRSLNSAHLPPLILHQEPGGGLTLIDGWHRVAAYHRMGVKLLSSLIVDTSLAEALIVGLRANIPRSGNLRTGEIAHHCLRILATALGRTIERAEANYVGLEHSENAPIPKEFIGSLAMPQLDAWKRQLDYSPRLEKIGREGRRSR